MQHQLQTEQHATQWNGTARNAKGNFAISFYPRSINCGLSQRPSTHTHRHPSSLSVERESIYNGGRAKRGCLYNSSPLIPQKTCLSKSGNADTSSSFARDLTGRKSTCWCDIEEWKSRVPSHLLTRTNSGSPRSPGNWLEIRC
ncbi:hypothetical protein SLE2022_230730 [Rubroshorea leprosula]